MGIDKRGKDRGECYECDCSDYEEPAKGSRCAYCDCAAPKHRLNGQTDIRPTRARLPDLPKAPAIPLAGRERVPDADPRDWALVEELSIKPTNTQPVISTVEVKAVSAEPPIPRVKADSVSFDHAIPPIASTPRVKAESISFDHAIPPIASTHHKKPDKVKARENARQPHPSRRKQTPHHDSPVANTAPNRKGKSVAVKCHNLDAVMSSHLSDPRTADRINDMFQNFDDDSSNELDRDECKQLTGYILEQCGLQPDIIPAFVYDEAFSKYDEDGGGTITLEEFREFLMSHIKHH